MENKITVKQLEYIIKCIKAQLEYEDTCSKALGMICPDCYMPILSNPIWSAFTQAMDAALGLDDFFSWWIWDTNCGEHHAEIYELDGSITYVRNAEEIINYAKKDSILKKL